MTDIQTTDFLVEVADPHALDSLLISLPGANANLIEHDTDIPVFLKVDGYYVMRVFGDPGFLKFACEAQGYCKIIRQLDELV